tara:strand:- start:449 stop:880 length:432 start_codon:yes stop_codon:yes gene_type:complete
MESEMESEMASEMESEKRYENRAIYVASEKGSAMRSVKESVKERWTEIFFYFSCHDRPFFAHPFLKASLFYLVVFLVLQSLCHEKILFVDPCTYHRPLFSSPLAPSLVVPSLPQTLLLSKFSASLPRSSEQFALASSLPGHLH